MEFHVPTVTIHELVQFHAKHFPYAPLPKEILLGANHESQAEYYDGDDSLGYYEDGVKRTLTDEQITMFRHSEIQRILLERRRRKEAGEPIYDAPSLKMENASTAESVRAASPASDQSTPMSISSDDEQAQATPVEKPQQKWTAISGKSRARNARNRNKNRRNHRARKKEERKKREHELKGTGLKKEESEEESDEWDPWHQAKGPDVQKDEAVDLDY
ncbi:hypothetical protein N0V90_011944 [Kalmusia sp. IMI 367209]|nr:hypothetical protein N0V90_011944 [Kalmusia sp. IMI 367209]